MKYKVVQCGNKGCTCYNPKNIVFGSRGKTVIVNGPLEALNKVQWTDRPTNVYLSNRIRSIHLKPESFKLI